LWCGYKGAAAWDNRGQERKLQEEGILRRGESLSIKMLSKTGTHHVF